MGLDQPYPELDEFLVLMGEAGVRISEINASEGAAGNLSMFFNWQVDPRRKFPIVEEITRVRSVDLVSDPATTSALFESKDATVPPSG